MKSMHTWLGDDFGWMGQRKSMRLIGSLLLLVAVMLGAVSCGGTTGGTTSKRVIAATPTTTPTPTATPIPFARPEVEAGVTVPEWSASAYSTGDTAWRNSLVAMQ